jgi:hypothetical protein
VVGTESTYGVSVIELSSSRSMNEVSSDFVGSFTNCIILYNTGVKNLLKYSVLWLKPLVLQLYFLL